MEVITKNIGDFINPLRIEDNVAEFSSENGYISISNACEIETYDNSSLPSLECIRERIDIQLTKFATLNYIHQRLTKEIPVTAGPTTINGKELTEITSQNIDNDTKLIHSLLKAVGTKETDIASRTQEILAAIPVDQRNDGFAEKISKCMLQKGFINDPKRGFVLYTDTPTSDENTNNVQIKQLLPSKYKETRSSCWYHPLCYTHVRVRSDSDRWATHYYPNF